MKPFEFGLKGGLKGGFKEGFKGGFKVPLNQIIKLSGFRFRLKRGFKGVFKGRFKGEFKPRFKPNLKPFGFLVSASLLNPKGFRFGLTSLLSG